MKKFLLIVIAIVICLGTGMTAAYFQAGSIHTWYPALAKPAITPPASAFPIAWGIIYVLMGISIGLIWGKPAYEGKRAAAWLFAGQLFLNFLWSISFFYMRNPALGVINISALDIMVICYALSIRRGDRLSAWLCVPYILWLALATYLNIYIMLHN